MLVRIIKSDDEENWYHDRIGETIKVKKFCNSVFKYSDFQYILREDCEIIYKDSYEKMIYGKCLGKELY